MISYDIVTFGEALVRHERPTPVPTGDEILLRISAAGVCHTDVHTRSGAYDLGGGKALRMADRGIRLPLTPGHEIVGEAVAAGEHVDPAMLGKPYLVYPWIGCGTCAPCQDGRDNMCAQPRSLGVFRPGGYSDHVIVPASRFLVDIAGLTPESAAPLACSGLTTYSALRKLDAQTLGATSLVVIGAGGLGLMCVRLARAMGGAGTIAVDINADRRQAAALAGARACFDPAQAGVAERIRAAAGGPILAVVDLVGSARSTALALDLLARGGKLLLVGLAGGELTLSLPLLPLRALSLEGCYVGTLQELRDLVALVRSVEMAPMPTTCRHLHEANDALDDLEAGNVVGRIVLRP